MKQKTFNKKMTELLRTEADTQNIIMRTKTMRMEAARRNIEVVFKCFREGIGEEEGKEILKKNLAVLNKI